MTRLTFVIEGFRPDYATHPGETLRELLTEWGVTQTEIAAACGVTQKHISEVVNGKAGIGVEFALSLEDVTRISAEFWVRMQAVHDVHRARVPAAAPTGVGA